MKRISKQTLDKQIRNLFYIYNELRSGGHVATKEFCDEFEVTSRTFLRYLNILKEVLNLEIEYDEYFKYYEITGEKMYFDHIGPKSVLFDSENSDVKVTIRNLLEKKFKSEYDRITDFSILKKILFSMIITDSSKLTASKMNDLRDLMHTWSPSFPIIAIGDKVKIIPELKNHIIFAENTTDKAYWKKLLRETFDRDVMVSKNPVKKLNRLLFINKILNENFGFSSKEMCFRLGIQDRTLRRDIETINRACDQNISYGSFSNSDGSEKMGYR